jgi:hypothetical protein
MIEIMIKNALHHEENDAFLGYVVKDGTGWQAQTVFGYIIARTLSEKDAEAVLRAEGMTYLAGIWQYYDAEEHDWFPCTIKDANEHIVTVIRTNALGYQEPETYKLYVIEEPTEEKLIKSA